MLDEKIGRFSVTVTKPIKDSLDATVRLLREKGYVTLEDSSYLTVIEGSSFFDTYCSKEFAGIVEPAFNKAISEALEQKDITYLAKLYEKLRIISYDLDRQIRDYFPPALP